MVSSVLNAELRHWEGMTLAQIGQAMGKDPRDALMDLVIADRAQTGNVVFFMSEGVQHLGDPRMTELANQGAKLSFCALNAMERSLDHRPAYPWGIEEASQFSLACIAEQADRFLCLA